VVGNHDIVGAGFDVGENRGGDGADDLGPMYVSGCRGGGDAGEGVVEDPADGDGGVGEIICTEVKDGSFRACLAAKTPSAEGGEG
jgi:hypothetical protein